MKITLNLLTAVNKKYKQKEDKHMKNIIKLAIAAIFAVSLVGCGSNESNEKVIKVAATSTPNAEVLKAVSKEVEKEGYTLEVLEFDDYITPNTSLVDKEVDLNLFQHRPFLEKFNTDNNQDLVGSDPILFTAIGIYSNTPDKYDGNVTIDDVEEGAKIVVPNDPTNEARALQLLNTLGIIKVKEGLGLEATKLDIIENPKNVDIIEVEAATAPTTLDDAQFVVANGNFTLASKITDKKITGEGKDSDVAKQFAVVVVSRKEDKNSEKVKVLNKALQSQTAKDFIEKTYKGAVIAIN